MTALLVVYFSGATVNAMVLAGLMIALGVIVDDAIAYSANLMRRLRGGPGLSIFRTLLEGLGDVRGPLMFATAVVVLAAIPVFFMAGTTGALIHPVVKTYVVAVFASLLVAKTVTPALALLLLKDTQLVRHESAFSGWVKRMAEGVPAAVPAAAALAVVIAGIVGSTALIGALHDPSAADSARAFFGSDTRAAALLVGVALALVWHPSELRWRESRRAGMVLDAMGVVAFVWMIPRIAIESTANVMSPPSPAPEVPAPIWPPVLRSIVPA